MLEGNPLLKDLSGRSNSEPMTVQGTGIKSLFLMALVFMGAMFSYDPSFSPTVAMVCALVAFVVAIITIKAPEYSMFTSPIYAGLEGIALGYVSVMADMKYPGIVIEAIMGTVGVFAVMATLYSQNIIKVNSQYVKIVMACMMGILFIYIADIIMALFGTRMPVINDSSPWGIAFSVGVVIVASLNLAIDFETIKENSENKAPKHMEWFCAFGLMVSIIWLYLEILRLLQKSKK